MKSAFRKYQIGSRAIAICGLADLLSSGVLGGSYRAERRAPTLSEIWQGDGAPTLGGAGGGASAPGEAADRNRAATDLILAKC